MEEQQSQLVLAWYRASRKKKQGHAQGIGHDNVLVDAHQVRQDVGIVPDDVDVEPKDPRVVPPERSGEEPVARFGDERSPDGLTFEPVPDFGPEVEVEILLEDRDTVVPLRLRQLGEPSRAPFQRNASEIKFGG